MENELFNILFRQIMASTETGDILRILKELQKSSKIQQQQIDKLITAFEITHSLQNGSASAGTKRSIGQILNASLEETSADGQADAGSNQPGTNVAEKKEHLDKMLEKPSFSELWNSLSVKLSVSDSVNNLKEKEKIMEILQKACERAKVVCTMNYDTLLTATLRRYCKDQNPSVSSMIYEATNMSQVGAKRACYAHNVDRFRKNMEDFHCALTDPCQHFIRNPRKYLLTESCFSSTAKLEFRSKRQRLPFAICCIRKPGFLSFFVGDWAFEDENLPNSSNLNHYTTLKLDKFVEKTDLESEVWTSMSTVLECAACPSDLDIGSVTMFMHEHRGNLVCAKVMMNKDTNRQGLRIYPHASFQTSIRPVFLNFDDDGEQYLLRIKNNETVTGLSDTVSTLPSSGIYHTPPASNVVQEES